MTLTQISTGGIKDSTIAADDIASSAVTTAKIASSAVTSAKIAADAVTTAKIADDAITTAKIANSAVNGPKIATGSVSHTKLAVDAVETDNIADNAVVNASVASNAAIDATKLSYTQSNTGAAARTVDSKLEDFVSVKDFGAVGDGSTNDYAAFNNALATEKAIYIPAGTYVIGTTLDIDDKNVTMFGDGERLSILKFTGTGNGLEWTSSDHTHSLMLEKFQFLAAGNLDSPLVAVMPDPPGTVRAAVSLENILATYTGTDNTWKKGFHFTSCRCSNIIETIFAGNNHPSNNNLKAQFGFKIDGESLDTQFENCQAVDILHSSHGQGFIVTGKCEGISYVDCLAISVLIGLDHATGVDASGNVLNDDQGNPLYEPGIRVINCHFNSHKFGVRISKSLQTIISNNLFYGNTESGAIVDYTGVAILNNSGNKFCSITDNIFHCDGRQNKGNDSRTDKGIDLEEGHSHLIANNIFTAFDSASSVGITIDADVENCQLSDNRFSTCTTQEAFGNTSVISLRADQHTVGGTANCRYQIAGNGNKDVQLRLLSGSDSFQLSSFSDGTAGIESATNSNIKFITNGTRMEIHSNGNIGAGGQASNIFNASDSRLKKDVVSLDQGLGAINSLRPVAYNWVEGFCDEEKDRLYGFIAQEVQTVDSNLISSFGSVKLDDATINDTLSVKEKLIIPILVKAVQELSAKITALENQN